MKHHMWRLVLDGRLHLAPIGDHPQRIIDVGTGSGIWAIEAADAYPSAEVIGFDISPNQPVWVPSNLHFEIDDLENEWLYKKNMWDFIHCRFMFMSIRDWPAMLRQAYSTLKPGGWIELGELNMEPGPSSPDTPKPETITQWFHVQGAALSNQGYDLRVARKFKQMLIDAGFEFVTEDIREVPWGPWPEHEPARSIGYWHHGMFCFIVRLVPFSLITNKIRTTKQRFARYHNGFALACWMGAD